MIRRKRKWKENGKDEVSRRGQSVPNSLTSVTRRGCTTDLSRYGISRSLRDISVIRTL